MRVFAAAVHINTGLFPFLFGGTFIEGKAALKLEKLKELFPFLFGGTFIEGREFPHVTGATLRISLPFRRDFH